MKKKTPYRIRNWPAYNAALIGRGSLALWVDEEAIRSWRYTGPTQRGAQYRYADAAITCVLICGPSITWHCGPQRGWRARCSSCWR